MGNKPLATFKYRPDSYGAEYFSEFWPLTRVLIKELDTVGTILYVYFDDSNSPKYNVEFWSNGNRQQLTFFEWELDYAPTK